MTGTDITLSGEERGALNKAEGIIHRGLKTFIEVGGALMAIRDGRLYRETHSTFELYCADKWKMTDRHARRLINAAEVVEDLNEEQGKDSGEDQSGPRGPVPTSEKVARELTSVPKEERKIVWHDTIEEFGQDPTAAQVRQTAHKRRGDESGEPVDEQAQAPDDGLSDPYADGGTMEPGTRIVTVTETTTVTPPPTEKRGRKADPSAEEKERMRGYIREVDRMAVWPVLDYFKAHKGLIDFLPESEVDEFISELAAISADARKLIQLIKDNVSR